MLLPDVSVLNPLLCAEKRKQIDEIVKELTPIQLAWLAGYLSSQANALDSVKSAVTTETTTESNTKPVWTILYGSQTGNSRHIAENLKAEVISQGIQIKIFSMADYNVRQLKSETLLTIVISTHGEGEAPDDAVDFYQYLFSKRAPKLANLRFSILALGDSSYEFYCQTGKDIDKQLTQLGATALIPRVDCDVDYETDVANWQSAVITQFLPLIKTPSPNSQQGDIVSFPSAQTYTKQQPFSAEIILNQKITGRHSDRNIKHVEIDLADSNITYQPGDALGVWFENNDELIEQILGNLAIDCTTQVTIDDKEYAIADALKYKKELTQLSPKVIEIWAKKSNSQSLNDIVKNKNKLREFMLNHQLVDLVIQYPINITANELVSALRGLTPRLYSIASSQNEVEQEVHLTVALVADKHGEHMCYGGASRFLAEANDGDNVRIYIEPNHHFRLPDNPQTPVIMIGPGTGIAPFRAFLQERSHNDDSGNNWLFFGNPHFEQDFLYQTELQQYLTSGVLTYLDVAFSRDQSHKIYVQHRIAERGEQFWQWLENGAHIYVCGDADKMAKDVHQAIIDVIVKYGEMEKEQAIAYLENLRRTKRYQKDIY